MFVLRFTGPVGVIKVRTIQMDSNDRKTGTGLQILVVGGSIGGISTAIALKAQGHCVKIYEQATSDDTQGAGITIFPNALGAARNLGVDLSNIRATKVKKVRSASVPSDAIANYVQDYTISS